MEQSTPGQAPSAGRVRELWLECDKALAEDRRHYWLNFAFYLGQQWITWEKDSRSVALLRDEPTKMRTTINKVGPGIDNLMGRLLKRDLSFESQMTGTDDVTMRGAKLGEFIIEADRRAEEWEGVREEIMFAILMGGTAAGVIEWDAAAGGQVAVNPDDQSKLHLGKVKLTAKAITEFSLQPYSRRGKDALWWINATTLVPEQVREQYKLDKTPEADAAASASPLQSRLLQQRSDEDAGANLCTVYTYYERPSNYSDGWVRTVVGDEVVAGVDGWPFPFQHLNCYVFRQTKMPLRWTGSTFVSSVRPLQFHYNMVRSTALDHANKVQNARLMVPNGAVADEDEFTNDVGEIVTYNADIGGEIKWLNPPEYQRQLANEADRIDSEIADVLKTHGTSKGELVGDRNSGLALSLVAEKDDSPLGVMARDQASGWGRLGTMALQLYESNSIEERTTRVQSANKVTTMRKWTGADIHGQTEVTVPIDATMPHSRVALQAMLSSLGQTFPQLFEKADPMTLAKILDVPNMDLIPGILDPDVKLAQWENEMMAEGEPVVPMPWHDHAKHIAELNAFRNSPSYEMLTDEQKSIFDMHVSAHEKMAAEEVATQAQLEQAAPGLSQTPQADNPPGSAVPAPLSLIQGGQQPAPPTQQPAPEQGAQSA